MSLPEGFQFSREFEVGSYQVHPDGKIRWSCLADLLQETAWRHADSADFGRNLLHDQLMWVLSRLEIQIMEFPGWGDQIQILTAGRGAEKLFAFREFLVLGKNGKILARAMSSWLLLHTQSKRIQRPETVLPPQLFDPSKKPDWQPHKLAVSGKLVGEDEIKVRHSDLDLYHHVNNTSYIRWVENALNDFGWKFSDIAINYLSECHAGDRISVGVFQEENQIFVQGQLDEKIVFLAKSNLSET